MYLARKTQVNIGMLCVLQRWALLEAAVHSLSRPPPAALLLPCRALVWRQLQRWAKERRLEAFVLSLTVRKYQVYSF